MKALCHSIGSAGKRAFRQIVRKIQMRAMGFVHQEKRVVPAADSGDPFQITGNSVIRRTDQKNRAAFRLSPESLLNGLRRDASPEIPRFQILRHHVNRRGSAHNQPHQHRFVDISRDNNFFSLPDGGKNHRLVAAGCSVDQKKGAPGMKQFRRQFLRLPDRPRGLMEIVQAFRLGQIQRSKIFPRQRRRQSPQETVSRNAEIGRRLVSECFQRLKKRHMFLIRHTFPPQKNFRPESAAALSAALKAYLTIPVCRIRAPPGAVHILQTTVSNTLSGNRKFIENHSFVQIIPPERSSRTCPQDVPTGYRSAYRKASGSVRRS